MGVGRIERERGNGRDREKRVRGAHLVERKQKKRSLYLLDDQTNDRRACNVFPIP